MNNSAIQMKKRIPVMMGRLSLSVVWFSEEFLGVEYMLLNYTFSSSLDASLASPEATA